MKKTGLNRIWATGALMLSLAGCDLMAPGEIINPNVGEDTFLASDNAMETWMNGVEKELAVCMSDYVSLMEILSDNYYNTYSRSSKVFDIPQLLYTDVDVTNLQRHVGSLREMADYGLNTVAKHDRNTTDDDLFKLQVVKGFSLILAGDFFRALPMKNGGEVVEWQQQLATAVEVLGKAIGLASTQEKRALVNTLCARAAHRLGNRAQAVAFAQKAIEEAADFCHQVHFDHKNNVLNNAQSAIGGNWFQPLPRLDFLDPKYHLTSNDEQLPIVVAKAEENFLILAEAALAENQLSEAKKWMKSLLALVEKRPVRKEVNDQLEGRDGGGIRRYPNSSEYRVRASEKDSLRVGLVIDRHEPNLITVPFISGTSVTEAMVNGLAQHDDALELLYLLRQEIFFAEGRRPADLGIRMPVCEVEAAKAGNAAPFTQALVPDFIPMNYGLDDFVIDDPSKTVTIKYNMNRIIVEHAHTLDVVPFE